MYHTITRLFIALLLVAGAFQSGKSLPTGCPLPPPDSVWVTGTTPTSISLAWTPVLPPTFIVTYKVSFYDVTTSTQLADEFTVLTYHTRTGLTPGHEYSMTISASLCNNDFGQRSVPIDDFTDPILILEDIVQNSCTPGGGQSPGIYQTYYLIAASPETTDLDQVFHFNVMRNGGLHNYNIAEFNLWAGCDGVVQFDKIAETNVVRTPPGDGQASTIYFYWVNGLETGDFFDITSGNVGQNGGQLVTPVYFHFPNPANCTVRSCSDYTGNNGCGGKVEEEEPQSRESQADVIGEKLSVRPSLSLLAMPNPSFGTFQLEYVLPSESAAFFTLSGSTGQVLRYFETPGILQAGTHTTNLQTDDLPPGLYFL
ncbi:MAG TPA: fibronectin type III domain-containing protein, partial [Saprospiraceae bacterium]|nr:fibronectin type III domain-containing protein [Saprospiraceae bacterium]